jgi:hypothetical protein
MLCKPGVSNSNWSQGHIQKEKCGPHLMEKKILRATNSFKELTNLAKFTIFLAFKMWASRTNASDGPRAIRGPHVWDPWYKLYFSFIIIFSYTLFLWVGVLRLLDFSVKFKKCIKVAKILKSDSMSLFPFWNVSVMGGTNAKLNFRWSLFRKWKWTRGKVTRGITST